MLKNLSHFKVLTRKEQQLISGGVDRCQFTKDPEKWKACKKNQGNSIS